MSVTNLLMAITTSAAAGTLCSANYGGTTGITLHLPKERVIVRKPLTR
jgi:hypothetical protein